MSLEGRESGPKRLRFVSEKELVRQRQEREARGETEAPYNPDDQSLCRCTHTMTHTVTDTCEETRCGGREQSRSGSVCRNSERPRRLHSRSSLRTVCGAASLSSFSPDTRTHIAWHVVGGG